MTAHDAWKLPRPADCCAACEVPLPAGMLCTTVIRLQAEAPLREDLCTTCGERAVADPQLCFWTRRRPESAGQRAVVDYAMLRELFGRMLQRPDEVYRRLSYLVALVLIRKRFLRLLGFQRRAGREVMVVTRGAGQPSLDVPAPLLTAADLLTVRDQLAQLLNADLADHDLPELTALRATAEAEPAPATGPARDATPAPARPGPSAAPAPQAPAPAEAAHAANRTPGEVSLRSPRRARPRAR